MVMAHLKTKATTGKPKQRKQWKWTLIRDLFEQGYSRENIVDLFHLGDWMMTLPSELDQELRRELKQYQAEKRVPYVSSFERLVKEEGWKEGRQEAKQVCEKRSPLSTKADRTSQYNRSPLSTKADRSFPKNNRPQCWVCKEGDRL